MTRVTEILTGAIAHAEEFRKSHNSLEQFIVVVGVTLTPAYLINSSLSKLILSIQSLSQSKQVPVIDLLILCTQTIIIFYCFGLIVNYFLDIKSSENNTSFKKKFEGVHEAVEYTYIPLHLVAKEIIPEEDNSLLENEILQDIPSVDDFIASQEDSVQSFTLEEILKQYEKDYNVEGLASEQTESKGVITALDFVKRNNKLDEILNSMELE